jgi:hypothetical protein
VPPEVAVLLTLTLLDWACEMEAKANKKIKDKKSLINRFEL